MTDELFLIQIAYPRFCGLMILIYCMSFMVGELFCRNLFIRNCRIQASLI